MSQTPQTPGTAHEPSAARGCEDGNGRKFAGPSPQEVYQRMSRLLAELKEYGVYFLMAKSDRLKVSARQAGIYAALGLMGVVVLCAALATGVVLTLLGLMFAFAALFGALWAGALLAGLVTLVVLGLGAWIGIASVNRSSRLKTVNKYEQRQQWERGQLGRTVHDAAAQHE
jgi:hypothetical protein